MFKCALSIESVTNIFKGDYYEKRLLKGSLVNVAISDIDLKSGPFCMSFNFNLEPLKGSIKEFGVINPPYLLTQL